MMTFEQYWQKVIEEELSRYQILDLRKSLFDIRRLVETKQLDLAVKNYEELLKNAFNLVQEYLASGDIEVEEFLKVLPKILEYQKLKKSGTANIKKKEADPDLLQGLRYINNLFTMGKLKAVINYLSSIYDNDPAAYAEFIKFAKSYKQQAGRTFREKVFPKVLEIHPDLGILAPEED